MRFDYVAVRKPAYAATLLLLTVACVLRVASSLAASPQELFVIERSTNRPRYLSSVRIAGKVSHLKRIWVRADDGLLGPQVRYIELEGQDATTGERVTERIHREARSVRRPR